MKLVDKLMIKINYLDNWES